MVSLSLNGIWTMEGPDGRQIEGTIPGSVYSFLLDAGEMSDPFYRDNELAALELVDKDYTFSRTFTCRGKNLAGRHQVLQFMGVDTLSEIYLNDVYLAPRMGI